MPQDKTLLVKLQNYAILVKKWYIYLDIKLSIIIPYILVHFIQVWPSEEVNIQNCQPHWGYFPRGRGK
jgi:hypothetical protein